MRFNKKYKQGLFLLFLLLIITSGITLVRNISKNNLIDENALSISALDDPMEDNDDFGSAWYVDPNWYPGLIIEGYDEDWFRTYLNPGETIDVSIYFSNIDGDLELELYDPSYMQRTDSYSSTDDEYVSFTADMSGDWRIRVYRLSGSVDVYYDLDIIFSTGDDWMEENDDFYNAWYVDPNYYSGLKIVGYDEDWSRTYLNQGDTIDVSIYFNHTDGDLELELYDPSYSWRDSSISSFNDYEEIKYTTDISGDWRVRVYHEYRDTDVNYNLNINLEFEESGDDPFEENDGFYSSAWIDPNYYSGLRIVDFDEDWFHLYLNTGDIIDVAIYFYHEEGDLQLELYDPDNNQKEGSYSSTENYDWSKEHIMYRADMAGDWRIRVYHETGDSDVHYDLDIKILDDFYEFNNAFHEAYDLHDDEYTWLSDIHGLAVQGDEDWYMIHVTPGFQHLIVNLMFEGNINVDLYKLIDMHTIEWRYGNHTMVGDHRIDINYTSTSGIDSGIYFIQVTGDYTGGEYNLWWDDLRTDTRDDDNYEENDDPLSAYDLSSHQKEDLLWINGSAIQRDNDWYKIKVDKGFEHLFVEVIYDYQEGAIGIAIYDWDFSEVTSNLTEVDMEFVNFDLPSNGTYYIRIFGDDSGNIYSLRWETWPYQEEMIPGYDIFILLSAIFGVATVITLKWKRSKRNL